MYNFAPIRRVLQVVSAIRATSRFMIGSANAIVVKSVVGRLLLGLERCWKDFVSHPSSFFSSWGFSRMAVLCRRLYMCLDWTSVLWPHGVTERDSNVNGSSTPSCNKANSL